MDLRVLGPMEVWADGQELALGGPRQRAVLAMLVAAVSQALPADQLIEAVWADGAPSGARSTLQTYMSNLRATLGQVVLHDRGGYRLAVEPESIDAVRFERALAEARTTMTTDPAGTADRLRSALSTWRGRPFADLVDVPGLDATVRRLEQVRLEAVELRVDAELASGHHEVLVAEVEALAEEHPTRERFRAQHMLALYRSGRQAEALAAFRRTEDFLKDELGLEPSPELRDLELAILQQDDSLTLGTGRSVTQRLAFLVTDIEGSTRLWDRQPRAMADALARHDRILAEAVESAGGRVFKHTGDGVLAAFPDAVSAVGAAEAAQRGLATAEWGEAAELRVRMGIDAGEAESRAGDFYGPPLNRASRLCAAGHGGQVLVSTAVQAEIAGSAPVGVQVRQLGEHRLKGLAAPERIGQLVFVGLSAEFPELRIDADGGLDVGTRLTVPGYEVRERIGEGAFGVVWRAYQPSVGREVAVKVIRPELAGHPGFVRRFEAEARTIARLAHPHIVPLIDFWRDDSGAYLVLQLLEGGSLATALDGVVVHRSAAWRILTQVGAALDHAHAQGLAHGDVKPANVLLDGAGNAYLSDFGIAARLLDPELVAAVSSAPGFRAPEEVVTGPTPEADRFAYGMLARLLLDGTAEVEPVLARATATRPQDRYPSAASILADLRRVLGDDLEETAAAVVSRNPYKGLRAFDEGDASDFFGRGELVAASVAAVADRRWVTVVGPSGSGKSSVVRAGLLPALAGGAAAGSADWFRVVMTPGERPVEALADALAGVATGDPVGVADLMEVGLADTADRLLGEGEGELVVVVDQFEEVYTLLDDPVRREGFVDLLTGAVDDPGSRVRVVATLRADFYDRPLADERLGRLVRDGLVTVLPPGREELVEMVAAPAQAVGLRFEPGLAHRIVEEVSHQPGGLPLLQYALTELVERRSGDLLTGADYDRVGGVTGALATRAEAVFSRFTPAQQRATRQLLLRLVTVDEDSDDTRRRVRRSELESLGIPRVDLDTVLGTLIGERLLLADRDPTTRGPTVEVAHEALLREWPRLAGWVEDQREALILGRRFRAALTDWETSGRDDDHLLTGSRLAPYLGWADTTSLTPDEHAFHRASRAKDDADRTLRRRRRRTLVAVLAAATTISATLGAVAAVQARRATTEADTARTAQALTAQERDRALTAEALAETQAERATVEARRARASELSAYATNALLADPALAKLLALASAQTADPSLDTISVLHQAWAADAVIARYTWPEDQEVASIWADIHPRLPRLVVGGDWSAGTPFEVWDYAGERVLWSFGVDDSRIGVDRPRFSPDGETVVAGVYVAPGADRSETLIRDGFMIETGDRIPYPTDIFGAHVWNAETGHALARFDVGFCGGLVQGVSDTHLIVLTVLDADSRCFRAGAPAAILIDLRTGERRLLTTRVGGQWEAFLSSDGRYVAYDDASSPDTTVSVVEDVETGARVFEVAWGEVDQMDSWVRALSADGRLLLAGDRPMAVWDVDAGAVLSTFDGHPAASFHAAFSSGGEFVYSSGREGTLLEWRTATGTEVARFPAAGSGSVSVTADGRVSVADHARRAVSVIDSGVRSEIWAVATCGGFVLSNTMSLGGGLASVTEICPAGGTDTFVIDLASQRVVRVIPAGKFQGSAISPDGTRLARADDGQGLTPRADDDPTDWMGPVRIRDTASGAPLTELQGVCVWNLGMPGDPSDQEGCASYPEVPHPVLPWRMRWSPDGRLIAVTMHQVIGGPAVVWDGGSGARLLGYDGCIEGVEDFIFSPDGSELVVFCTSEGRIVAIAVATGEERRSGVIDRSLPGSDRLGFIGYTPDGSTLLAAAGGGGLGGGSLLWIDPVTFDVVDAVVGIHEGSPKAWALSPSGSLVATGSTDGLVKVWDVENRVAVHEIKIGAEVQGVAFVDDRHLAVAPQTGGFYVYTIDLDDLLEIVRGSLTRGFTPLECERYGFGDDCPTLDDLRGDAAASAPG